MTGEEHFRNISALDEEVPPSMLHANEQVKVHMTASFKNEDFLLDVPFCTEEIEATLQHIEIW